MWILRSKTRAQAENGRTRRGVLTPQNWGQTLRKKLDEEVGGNSVLVPLLCHPAMVFLLADSKCESQTARHTCLTP